MKELIGEYFNVILEALIMSIFVSVILEVTKQFLGLNLWMR